MKNVKPLLTTFFILSIVLNISANLKRDVISLELREEFGKSLTDTARYNKAIALAEYYKTVDIDSSTLWLHKALCIARTIDQRTTAKSYRSIGEFYLNLNEQDSAAFYFEKALQFFEDENMLDEQLQCWEILADLYLDLGKYDKTLDLTQKQLEAHKKSGNKAKIARAYQDLGYLYYFMGEYASTLENYTIAMNIYQSEHLEYEYYICSYYNAMMYYEIGDYETCRKTLLEDLTFFKKYESGRAEGVSYAATIYKRMALLDIETGYYQEGLEYCDSAFARAFS